MLMMNTKQYVTFLMTVWRITLRYIFKLLSIWSTVIRFLCCVLCKVDFPHTYKVNCAWILKQIPHLNLCQLWKYEKYYEIDFDMEMTTKKPRYEVAASIVVNGDSKFAFSHGMRTCSRDTALFAILFHFTPKDLSYVQVAWHVSQ